jgi:hypothetical protein
MANKEHLEILKKGVEGWNRWRALYPKVQAGGLRERCEDSPGCPILGL